MDLSPRPFESVQDVPVLIGPEPGVGGALALGLDDGAMEVENVGGRLLGPKGES
jgi:hypothetical protein